jgi:DNA polymerase-4
MRWILHIDMDAFFAAVEQNRRPELAGKPVIVGGTGDPTKRGVVASASYEARHFGVQSAMPLQTAKKLCPLAVFLPADFEEYARVSRIIKDILRSVSPVMEDVGIDEAYIDVSLLRKNPEEVAKGIKEMIRAETGLTCSIGIGPNKLLAKTASDLDKPGGLSKITEDEIESIFWTLPIKKLRGVGPKTEARLRTRGIRTIGALAQTPLPHLLRLFGRSHAHHLHRASRGLDDGEIVPYREPKSIGKETTFQRDTGKHEVIRVTLAKLAKNTVDRMIERGFRARSVTVKVRFDDFETQTRTKTLARATDSITIVRSAAFDCLARFRLNKKLRLIGVRLGNLETGGQPSGEQGPEERLL